VAIPGNQGAQHLTADRSRDITFNEKVENQDRQVVIAAQANRGRVGDLEITGQDIVIGQARESARLWIASRIAVVHAVNGLRHENDLGTHLKSTLSCGGVGRKIWSTKAGAENDNATFLQVSHGSPGHVGFGYLSHRDGSLHPSVKALLFAEVLQCQAIHDGAKHAHVVGPTALHAPLGQFSTTKVVATTDYNGDLSSARNDPCDLTGNGVHDIGINAEFATTSESFAGQLQQHPTPATRGRFRPGGYGSFEGRLKGSV